MRLTTVLLPCCLLLGACTLPQNAIEPVTVFVPTAPERLTCPVPDLADVDRGRVAQPPPWDAHAKLPSKPGAKPLTAPQLVKAAEAAAVVTPSERGYFGGSAVQRYQWMPNKIYTVLVNSHRATKVQLPPGETAIASLTLDPAVWEVGKVTQGRGARAFDVFFIRAQSDTSTTVDVSILTEAGHSFDLRLISGTTGMFGVAWEAPIPTQDPDEEEPLGGLPVVQR